MSLLAQVEILNAKLSMSAFGAVHALGGVRPGPGGRPEGALVGPLIR
jgi:hypothetical protein